MINTPSIYKYIDKVQYQGQIKYISVKWLSDIHLKRFSTKKILFIFGVQRSGTTISLTTINDLFGVKGYHEFSEITELGDEKIRLSPYPFVKKEISRHREPYILCKPLVESQVADYVLRQYRNSKGIWMFRNYKDVVSSFLKKFGEGIGKHHLDLIVNEQKGNWRAERIPSHLTELAKKFDIDTITNEDATALYWYIRSSLFYEYDFDKIDRLKLLRYEHFMENPQDVTRKILEHWDYTYEVQLDGLEFNTASINKGTGLALHPEIESLCDEMASRLIESFKQQSYFV